MKTLLGHIAFTSAMFGIFYFFEFIGFFKKGFAISAAIVLALGLAAYSLGEFLKQKRSKK